MRANDNDGLLGDARYIYIYTRNGCDDVVVWNVGVPASDNVAAILSCLLVARKGGPRAGS